MEACCPTWNGVTATALSAKKALTVDHCAARQPGQRTQPAHLHVRGIRVVVPVLLAILRKPGAHVFLVLRPPAAPAVDEQLVLRHPNPLRRRIPPGGLP